MNQSREDERWWLNIFTPPCISLGERIWTTIEQGDHLRIACSWILVIVRSELIIQTEACLAFLLFSLSVSMVIDFEHFSSLKSSWKHWWIVSSHRQVSAEDWVRKKPTVNTITHSRRANWKLWRKTCNENEQTKSTSSLRCFSFSSLLERHHRCVKCILLSDWISRFKNGHVTLNLFWSIFRRRPLDKRAWPPIPTWNMSMF